MQIIYKDSKVAKMDYAYSKNKTLQHICIYIQIFASKYERRTKGKAAEKTVKARLTRIRA